MSNIGITNEQLEVVISTHGAELCSVKDVKNGHEYLWNADPAFWGRHAPILFPFVGTSANKQYIHNNTVYPMGQHGFARDMEFVLESQTDSCAWFRLSSDETTLQKYPFLFHLHLGYQLSGRSVTVMYRVENLGEEPMYFSIGAHPAFVCDFQEEKHPYYFKLQGASQLSAYYIDTDCGLKKDELMEVALDHVDSEAGYLKLSNTLFEKDALIIEQTGIHQVSLCDEFDKTVIQMSFDAPLFGLWSPAQKKAPFVCIEPWYGRCDAVGFSGELKEKEYVNCLKSKDEFERSYQIEFLG